MDSPGKLIKSLAADASMILELAELSRYRNLTDEEHDQLEYARQRLLAGSKILKGLGEDLIAVDKALRYG